MVRFKDIRATRECFWEMEVSIPIWFDLKEAVLQYVSEIYDRFNSYMVRFKARTVRITNLNLN